MMSLFATTRTPIGLDVGPRSVAAAQLTSVGGGRGAAGRWKLQAGMVVDRPAGAGSVLRDEEALRIAQVLQRQGFTGADVVLAVPDQRLIGGGAATLELPPRSSGAPLEQLARMEMSRAYRLEASSFEMACWEVPGPNRAAEGSHMMAVACRHSDADEMIDGLESAGLRMAALDARSWAIARACQGILAHDERLAAVLDLTQNAALLAIVHEGAPAYERVLADGAIERLQSAIRLKLGIDSTLAEYIFERLRLDTPGEDNSVRDAATACNDYLDNLASELRTAIAYAEHRFDSDIRRVLIQGSGAAIPGIQERLSALLTMPAQVLRPGDVVQTPEDLTGSMHSAISSPALLVAVGLAMHSAGSRASRRATGGAS